MTPLELLDLAQKVSIAVVDRVKAGDLTKPCPCAGWTVSTLLDKMVTAARFTAAVVAGQTPGPDINILFPKPLAGPDPAKTYREACAECIERITACGLEGEMVVPAGKVPKAWGVMNRVLDCTLNTWDLAKALGVDPEIGEVQAAAVLAFSEDFFPKVRAMKDHTRFAEPVEPPAGATTLERLLAASGRRPDWRP